MALHESPGDERQRFWNAHNNHGQTLTDHGYRIADMERRVGHLEAQMSEQYGAVCSKLDGVGSEVRGLSDKFIAMQTLTEERERQGDKSLSMKWPLVMSVLGTLISIAALVSMLAATDWAK